MRRLGILLTLLAAPAFAQRVAVSVTETQDLTRAAPTTAAEGQALSAAKGLRVTVCAAAGQTLSGAGTLRAWYYGAVWGRNSALDQAVPAAAAGVRCWTFPDLQVHVRAGRVLFAADSVTVSGGTTVTVRYDIGV
jgi:hypothetical protein